ncbi:GNAT family N-acetyltransferase [Flavobacteriales bacterium]|nr:GNAT family N-acetyltransferase [Flavobacteriales bacterium]
MKLVTKFPGHKLPDAYYDARYEILRKPLSSPKGSEHLPKDLEAVNVWLEADYEVAAVGRAHLLEPNEDGSAVDVKANSKCPAFGPLSKNCKESIDDSGKVIPADLRPAIQVRAMGTIEKFRGQGFAAMVLAECEKQSQIVWEAKTGWLQARVLAIPFYQKCGWVCFGPEYHVPNVGPHRSMWKKFEKLNA